MIVLRTDIFFKLVLAAPIMILFNFKDICYYIYFIMLTKQVRWRNQTHLSIIFLWDCYFLKTIL